MNYDQDKLAAREKWGSRAEFLLSCIGYSVGLGNIWRFPFLVYENGGGAFLIPYIVILVLVGKPMYFMEAALGQFGQVGPLKIWTEMLPAAVGIGVAMVVISLLVAIYYNVIMAYCLFYLFNSFRAKLPWTECDSDWADLRCYERGSNMSVHEKYICVVNEIGGCTETKLQTSGEQYWEKKVLNIRESGLLEIGDLGELKMDLVFYLMLSWIIVFICLFKGIKSSGKVVYFSATFPYLVLFVLLGFCLSLPGATQGLHFLFIPEWDKILSFTVWRRAASQVFFSLGISWGGIIMFGSYNRFDSKIHIDAHIVSVIDFLTSLLASLVIFSTLGHSAQTMNLPLTEVVKGGQGLAFVAYPEALSQLPVPHLWCTIFFLMLFLLGLDSEFALFETASCAIFDAFPTLRKSKTLVTSLMCTMCFIIGLPCVTECGQYVLDLMDKYGASLSVLIIGIVEMVAVMWVYGVHEFCMDLKRMLGFSPGWYFKICWSVISPLVLIFIFIGACVDWIEPSYGNVLPYPRWAHNTGWVLTLISVAQIPLWFLIVGLSTLCKNGSRSVLQPTEKWQEKGYIDADASFQFMPRESSTMFREYSMTQVDTDFVRSAFIDDCNFESEENINNGDSGVGISMGVESHKPFTYVQYSPPSYDYFVND